MNKIKCLVTGGTGFIGYNLTKQLQKENYEVELECQNITKDFKFNRIKPILEHLLKLSQDSNHILSNKDRNDQLIQYN